MKHFIITFFFCWGMFMLHPAMAQEQISWYETPDNLSDSRFYTYIGENSNGYGSIFTYPEQKFMGSLKYGIAVKYLNPGENSLNVKPMPDDLPPNLAIRTFRDYIVAWGTGEKNRSEKGDGRVIFFNGELEVVAQRSKSLEGGRHDWKGARTYISADSNYFIVDFSAQCTPDAPSAKADPLMHYITVFDKDLNVVWEANIDFTKLFGGWHVMLDYELGFTSKQDVVVMAQIAQKNKCHSVAYILSKSTEDSRLLYNTIGPTVYGPMTRYLNTKDDEIVLMTTCYALAGVKEFSICIQNLYSGEPAYSRIYKPGKELEAKFPVLIGKRKIFPGFNYVFKADDGIIAIGENFLSVDRIARDITIVRFSMKGEIEWVKVIEKSITVPYCTANWAFNAFLNEEEIVLFYHDDPTNVNHKPTDPELRRYTPGTCVAMARISFSGEILEKKVVHSNKSTGIDCDLPKCYRIDDNNYFFAGRGDKKMALGILSLE